MVVGLLLFAVFSSFPAGVCTEGGMILGFPYIFYASCADVGPSGPVPGEPSYNWVALVVDVVLWYVFAAVIVTVFRSLRPEEAE